MLIFILLLGFVIGQRILELVIARRNEYWMKSKGAIEYGQGHYKYIVFMHVMFFLFLILEVLLFKKQLSPYWPVLGSLFFVTQIIRIWSLMSLGRFWNTKIIILPNANVVKRGPYQFIRHPNYLVVAIEIITLPLLFNAFLTAFLFSIINAYLIWYVRIPVEEAALYEVTNYKEEMMSVGRFSFIRK